jgi:hypothetical protein
MRLGLASWREPQGQRFVLDRQLVPSTTIYTWFKGGLLSKRRYHAAVKSLVETRSRETEFTQQSSADAQRSLTHARAKLDAWETEYHDLVTSSKWSLDPGILFSSPDSFRGRLGFYRSHGGTVFFSPEGQLRDDSFANRLAVRYRWHEEGKTDPVDDPGFIAALFAALRAYDACPYPKGSAGWLAATRRGESWVASSDELVRAVVGAIVAVRPQVGSFFDTTTRMPCSASYQLTARDGARDRIESETLDFGEFGDLGQGYQLARHLRRVVYDRDERRVISDRVEFHARHQNGDRIELELVLAEATP